MTSNSSEELLKKLLNKVRSKINNTSDKQKKKEQNEILKKLQENNESKIPYYSETIKPRTNEYEKILKNLKKINNTKSEYFKVLKELKNVRGKKLNRNSTYSNVLKELKNISIKKLNNLKTFQNKIFNTTFDKFNEITNKNINNLKKINQNNVTINNHIKDIDILLNLLEDNKTYKYNDIIKIISDNNKEINENKKENLLNLFNVLYWKSDYWKSDFPYEMDKEKIKNMIDVFKKNTNFQNTFNYNNPNLLKNISNIIKNTQKEHFKGFDIVLDKINEDNNYTYEDIIKIINELPIDESSSDESKDTLSKDTLSKDTLSKDTLSKDKLINIFNKYYWRASYPDTFTKKTLEKWVLEDKKSYTETIFGISNDNIKNKIRKHFKKIKNIENIENIKKRKEEYLKKISSSLIPIYQDDKIKNFYKIFLEKLNSSKNRLEVLVNNNIIKDKDKINKESKLTRGKLHQSNMIVYYIIPLIYLIYSYVYIKFNKEQKLQLSYSERKLKFEMFSFMFDLKNPIIKKINVFLYETFNTKNKEEVNVQTNILNNIISTKDKVVAFIQFMNKKIVDDDDYVKEYKILEIISKNIDLIETEFNIIKIKTNTKTNTKTNIKTNTNTGKNDDKLLVDIIDDFKKTDPISNKLSNYIEISRLIDRKFNTIVSYINEINKNIILLKDLKDVEILDINMINTKYINKLKGIYSESSNSSKLTNLKNKSNSQKEIIKNNEKLIILLNSEIEIYERIFSLNSKIDGYSDKVKKYYNIIKDSKKSINDLIYNILQKSELNIQKFDFNIAKNSYTSKAGSDAESSSNTKVEENTIYNPLIKYESNKTINNINITKLFGIFFISMFLYKDSEYSYLETILNNSQNLDRIKTNINKQKEIQFDFVDIFRLYKNNLNKNNDNIEVLENIQKDIIRLREDTARESEYIKPNTEKNSQSKKTTNEMSMSMSELDNDISIKRKQFNKKKNECDVLESDNKIITGLKERVDERINIKPNISNKNKYDDILQKITIKNNKTTLYNIKNNDTAFDDKFKINKNDNENIDRLLRTYQIKKTYKYFKIIILYETINEKHRNAFTEKDNLEKEIKKLEIDKFKLQKKIEDKESLKNLLKNKLIELNNLNTKVDEKLKTLKEKDSLPKQNYASLKTEFDNTFTETLSISEKYKEIVNKIVIKTSHNPIYLIYNNNNQIFKNTASSTPISINTNTNTNINELTKIIINVIINKKPDDKFIEELYNNHLKNQTPVVIPFFEEYKKHSDELKKTIIKLLTKINNSELKKITYNTSIIKIYLKNIS